MLHLSANSADLVIKLLIFNLDLLKFLYLFVEFRFLGLFYILYLFQIEYSFMKSLGWGFVNLRFLLVGVSFVIDMLSEELFLAHYVLDESGQYLKSLLSCIFWKKNRQLEFDPQFLSHLNYQEVVVEHRQWISGPIGVLGEGVPLGGDPISKVARLRFIEEISNKTQESFRVLAGVHQSFVVGVRETFLPEENKNLLYGWRTLHGKLIYNISHDQRVGCQCFILASW